MSTALVAIANGSEEIESSTVIDVLRRAQVEVTVASVEKQKTICASRAMRIEADCLIADCSDQRWDVIVLPGGMPGAERLGQCDELIALLREQFASKRLVAAICAAPAVVLAQNNLLSQFRATCYPAFMEQLKSSARSCSEDNVVIDKHLITSRGPATAMAWSLSLVSLLCGEEKATELAKALLVY
ncbi:DJ-1 family glyoxalase III [Agaribacterium haliotis]|uniref:DJ-1 family glyoxalase III n=1 Tax=Agaribacterium haliotis TaxID=2013869 RepID=UPI000BB54F5A|nr:DJ-1 family glyoxalase III [Agaribacterium haliotis]